MVNTKIYDLPESISLDINAVVPVVDFVGGQPVSRKVKASALGNGGSIPTKATGAEITTGTDDAKFATPKALKDAGVTPILTKATGAEVNTGTDDAKFITPKALEDSDYIKSGVCLPLAGGTMTGKVVEAGRTEVAKTYTPATGSQTVTIDCNVNNMHFVTGNTSGTAITFAVSNVTNNQCFIVSILQGSGTVSTIASRFSTVRRAGGSAPTLTATLNKRDTFGFICTGTNTYDGFIIGQNC